MKISILVADDEAELVESYSLLLRDLGYEVYAAYDGVQTIAALRDKNPHVLILDISMPKKSGEEVLQELARLGLRTRVIVSTGQAGNDRLMKDRVIKNFSVSAFLEKPTSIEEMDYVIKEVLKEL